MNVIRRYISRHQIFNPGNSAVRLYDELTGFSRKVSLSDYIVPPTQTSLHGKTILIAMFRASISSNFLELLLYRELRARGAIVKVVLCDGEAFPCDNITSISNVFNYRCLQCKAVQNRFKEQIASADILYVRRSTVPVQMPLAVNAVASAKRFDMSEDYDVALALRYQGTYMSVIELLRAQQKIDMVIMSHGMYATWGAFRDYCVEHGIDYITWGRTYFNKMMGVVKNSTFNEGPGTYDQVTREGIFHDAEYAMLVRSLVARANGGMAKTDPDNYYAYLAAVDTTEVRSDLPRAANGRQIIAVYLSIPWDGTVFGANGEFQSQRDLIVSIISMARANTSLFFVFRVHPRESEMPEKAVTHINEALHGDRLSNLMIVDPQARLTSYELAQMASINILYSGTLAIEFAFAGFPLVVCGKSLVFGIESVTFINSVAALEEIVNSADFAIHIPNKQYVLDGLRKISAVLYHDDLTDSDNYEVKSIHPQSNLVRRIIKELIE